MPPLFRVILSLFFYLILTCPFQRVRFLFLFSLWNINLFINIKYQVGGMKISATFFISKIVEFKLSAVQFSDLSRRLRATLPEGESFSAELEHFHRRFIKNSDLSRRLRATLPEGESFFGERGQFLPLSFKFAALHILYNCFTDFSLLNNFSGCIM